MEISRLDSELPSKMAGLDLIDNGINMAGTSTTECNTVSTVRVLRTRKPFHSEFKQMNRRVLLKPRKRSSSEIDSEKEIEAIYLNKKIKTTKHSLETIFEEPKVDKNNTVMLVGGKKLKRMLSFQLGPQYTKEKIKRRKSKIKRLLGNKGFSNRKKMSMKSFLKAMEGLDEIEEKPTPSVSSQSGNTSPKTQQCDNMLQMC